MSAGPGPLRVLWVASQLESHWRGGVGRVIAGTLPALAARGHAVHLAGRARGEPGPLAGVTLHPWPAWRQKLRQLPSLLRLVRALDPDVVHFHAARPHGDVIVPLRWWRRRRPRPVLVVTPYTGSRSYFARRFARAGLRAADRLIPNSRRGAERAVAAGADKRRVRVISAGADLPPAPRAKRSPSVVALSRLVPSKGLDVLVDAFALAAASRPDWRLRIAGAGEEAGALRARALASAVGDRVDLLGDVRGDAKTRLVGEAAVGVQPSRDDNYPGSLLELQAWGVACIGSEVGGIAEILDAGRAGLLVPPGDAGALAGALGRMMDDAPLRQRLGAAGRALAEGRAWERIAERLEQAYREAAAERAAR